MNEAQKTVVKTLAPAVVIGVALELYMRLQQRKFNKNLANGRKRVQELRDELIETQRENQRKIDALDREITKGTILER